MDSTLPPDGSTKAGTAGGVLLVLLTLNWSLVLETAVLAAIGALVSYTTSLALKAFLRWCRKE